MKYYEVIGWWSADDLLNLGDFRNRVNEYGRDGGFRGCTLIPAVEGEDEQAARRLARQRLAADFFGPPPHPRLELREITEEQATDGRKIISLRGGREITNERGGVETVSRYGGNGRVSKAILLRDGSVWWQQGNRTGVAGEGGWRYMDERPASSKLGFES